VSRINLLSLAVALIACVTLPACGSGDNTAKEIAHQDELQRARADAAKQQRQEDRLNQLERDLKAAKVQKGSTGSGGGSSSSGSSSGSSSSGGTSCGEGVTVTGPTTCGFGINVKNAYYAQGQAGTIDAYSGTTQRIYTMSCSSGSPHHCTGGNGASVYFP
jgi:hypothetical protein